MIRAGLVEVYGKAAEGIRYRTVPESRGGGKTAPKGHVVTRGPSFPAMTLLRKAGLPDFRVSRSGVWWSESAIAVRIRRIKWPIPLPLNSARWRLTPVPARFGLYDSSEPMTQNEYKIPLFRGDIEEELLGFA
jgi:hypothetical protein